ncbi:MAG TPA: DNA mismatch repair endonuclease MutL [Ktedonobacteraceae bacterium]|nr:DNA mismatch repair endonuclease MutL [Ktedonobacteraceae bacterium]
MPIKQLAPEVAAKIAAGEVVERPASVVKELIENSIDAGATQIRVDLINGGLQLIRVTDSGSGIPTDELPLALARHATSKVAQIDDLEHIRSLGFRGEALASIAAVAEVTLLSCQHSTEQGAQVEAHNGQISEITTAASAEGTTITVRNLFSSVPARLKFLKSRNTEVSHCHHLLQQYALAYPEIRFSVFSDGRQIFTTPGDGKLPSVLVEVYGLQIAEQMVPISNEQRSNGTEYPIVTGYVSRPTCYKSTRQYISFFVNRRWVMSRMLTAAVEGAYHSLLLAGRHPLAVVNIQIDPTLLDVNVHPAKTEIRFLKERKVFAAILNATRQALLEGPEIPQWQPVQQPTGSTSTAPSTTACSSSDILDEDLFTIDNETAASATSSDEIAQSLPLDSPWITVAEEETGTKPPMLSRLWQSHIKGVGGGDSVEIETIPNSAAGQETQANASRLPTTHQPTLARGSSHSEQQQDTVQLPQQESHPQSTADIGNTTSSRRDDSWLPQRTATPSEAPEGQTVDPHQSRRLPRLRVVGQVAQSYIVTEGEDGSMYLIDQHAAHERILLERMVAAMKSRQSMSQLLLTPINLELAPSELEAIEEHQSQLEQIGFSFAIAEDSALEIRAVPSVLVKQMNVRSLHELMVDLTSEESLGHTETWEERALANVACKAAIKANYFLTVSEMREMIEQLEQTRAPYSCCHGRPTMVHFSPSALAHAFERR